MRDETLIRLSHILWVFVKIHNGGPSSIMSCFYSKWEKEIVNLINIKIVLRCIELFKFSAVLPYDSGESEVINFNFSPLFASV